MPLTREQKITYMNKLKQIYRDHLNYIMNAIDTSYDNIESMKSEYLECNPLARDIPQDWIKHFEDKCKSVARRLEEINEEITELQDLFGAKYVNINLE